MNGEDNGGQNMNQPTGDNQIWVTNVKLLYAFLELGPGRSATEFPWVQPDLCVSLKKELTSIDRSHKEEMEDIKWFGW